jgi:hypothetical protein
MATISKGITLKVADKVLTNLQEIPELGGTAESIEITTLADAAHMYTDGIKNYGDSLTFKFLYEKAQFEELNALKGSQPCVVTIPGEEEATCTFSGTVSVKLDGVGVNAALTYTLSVKPDSEMVWA